MALELSFLDYLLTKNKPPKPNVSIQVPIATQTQVDKAAHRFPRGQYWISPHFESRDHRRCEQLFLIRWPPKRIPILPINLGLRWGRKERVAICLCWRASTQTPVWYALFRHDSKGRQRFACGAAIWMQTCLFPTCLRYRGSEWSNSSTFLVCRLLLPTSPRVPGFPRLLIDARTRQGIPWLNVCFQVDGLLPQAETFEKGE